MSSDDFLRRPDVTDQVETHIYSRSGGDELILASHTVHFDGFEQHVYIVVDVGGDESSIIRYQISNPYGDFRYARDEITTVEQLCAPVVSSDSNSQFGSLAPHLPLEAALQKQIGGHVGVIFQTGVADQALFFARVARVGREDEIVIATAAFTGPAEVLKRYGQAGMRAYEAGDHVCVQFLVKKSVSDFEREVGNHRQCIPQP